MSDIRVNVLGQENLSRLRLVMLGMQGDLETALQQAMRKSASRLRSESVQAIQKHYDISAANIRAAQNISVRYQYGSGVTAFITFSGKKIPLYRYHGTSPVFPVYDKSKTVLVRLNGGGKGTWKPVHPSPPAYAHQLKSTSPQRFTGAFVAKMTSGHVGIFERTGAYNAHGVEMIRELMGSSVAQMLGNQEVAEQLTKEVSEDFQTHLDQEISRLLTK